MLNKKRVLVIEEEPAHGLVIEANLRLDGYECDIAPPREGWARLFDKATRQGFQYQCVIVEIHLTYISGWDFLAKRDAEQDDLPLVLMCVDGYERTDAERCGADGFLCKSRIPDELVTVVEQAIEHRRNLRLSKTAS